jgi:formyltetrahydrofolate synthetase
MRKRRFRCLRSILLGQNQRPTGATTENARKLEIESECANLLKLATDLKTEVDKSNKDMLSLAVVRKASEIEQVAHKVRAGSSKN